MKDGEFHQVRWEPGAQDAQVRSLTFVRHGDLWVGLRDRGMVRLKGGVLVGAVTAKDGLPSDEVRSVLERPDGSLVIGTFRGLALWRAGKVARGPAGLDGIAIDEVVQDGRGELWCATANGLAHVRGDLVEWVGADRLPTTRVRQLLFDRDGNLWTGTGSGVARMTPNGQIELLASPARRGRALLEPSGGDLGLAPGGGLDRLRDGDAIPFGPPQGATSSIVMT